MWRALRRLFYARRIAALKRELEHLKRRFDEARKSHGRRSHLLVRLCEVRHELMRLMA